MKPRKPLARKTPLKRTELKRGKCELKRSRLNPVSKKKKERDAANAPMLEEYRTLFPKCQCCGRNKAREIHETFSAGRRQIAREHRSCILHLCPGCHRFLQHQPKSAQLYVKMRSDPKGYDLPEWNELHPGDPVSQADVDAHDTALYFKQ